MTYFTSFKEIRPASLTAVTALLFSYKDPLQISAGGGFRDSPIYAMFTLQGEGKNASNTKI